MNKWLYILILLSLPYVLKAHNTINHTFAFIENKGQYPKPVYAVANFSHIDLFIEKNSFTYVLYHPDSLKKIHPNPEKRNIIIPAHAFQQIFINTNENKIINKINPSYYYENYFIGNNPENWATFVRRYESIELINFYNKINLLWKYENNKLKYEFHIKQGGDPTQIIWKYNGINNPIITKDGNILIKTNAGNFIETKPIAYQIIGEKQVFIKCYYKKIAENKFTFYFPNGYNKNYELVIDPTLVFATYSGSLADNWGFTATYDRLGNMFIGGMASGSGYPVTLGAFQTVYAGGINYNNSNTPIFYPMDMAIMKINDTGSQILWATYIGGSNNEQPHSMIVNKKYELFILGATRSSDFPTTANAYDTTFNGGSIDIVVIHLNPDGSNLIGSTYLGGNDIDGISPQAYNNSLNPLYYFYADDGRGEIKLTNAGEPIIISVSASNNFPIVGNVLDSTNNGLLDAIVVKLTPNLDSIIFSTFIGGIGHDAGYGIDINPNGDILLAGGTTSPDFPITANAYDKTLNTPGTPEGWLAIITPNADSIKYATFFGTPQYDQVYFAQFSGDSIFFVGHTEGTLSMIGNVWGQPNRKQFIGCISYQLDTLYLLTTFGKQSLAETQPILTVNAFMVDNCNKVYFSGWGGTWLGKGSVTDLYVSPSAIQSTTDGNDFYIIVFDKDLTGVYYATYIGGNMSDDHVDGGTSRFDKYSIVYQNICGGCGGYSDFPTTPGVISDVNKSTNCNNLAIKLDLEVIYIPRAKANYNILNTNNNCPPYTIQFNNQSTNASGFFWDFGDGTTSNQTSPVHTFNSPGTYNVMLVAFPASSLPTLCTDNDTLIIEINIPSQPSADITFSEFCDSGKVSFDTLFINSDTLHILWDFGDGNSSTSISPTHYYNQTGPYNMQLIVYNSYGCADTIAKQVFAYHKPNLNATIDTIPCQLNVKFSTDTAQYTTIFWNLGDGNSSSLANFTHTYSTPGNYNVILTKTINNKCSYSNNFNINIKPKSIADFSLSMDTCKREITIINNSKNYNVDSLTLGDGTSTSNFSIYTHQYNFVDTTFYVSLITEYNIPTCSDTLTKAVNIPYIPLAKFTLQGDKCDTLQLLNAVGAVADSFLWYVNGNLISQDSITQYIFAYDSTYNVTLVVLIPNHPICYSDTTSIDTIITNTSEAIFDIIQNCNNITLINKSKYDSTDIPDTLFLWDLGNGDIIINVTNPNYTYNLPGNYTISLIVKPESKCKSVTSKDITIPELPEPKFNIKIEPCTFFPTLINQTNPKTLFYWIVNNNKYIGDSITVTDVSDGSYINIALVLYDSLGCEKIKDTTINLSKSQLFKMFIPNAFTPNNDGTNDIFEIKGESETCFKSLTIYDRWGNKIYYTNQLPLQWDGKQNGKPAPEGVYVYIIETITGYKRVGTITLLR